ncbi:hydroxymethylglutaryl-CoA lyase [Oceanibacterium hippocampi]|uniref:Hydroxymethylglutaryl-CoA lyase YngG n=1 Tax=Oceanibacterium hippocampi TaxID=745714 RepID=A0A1Y5TJN8_9PROT|nr:hydroxymethylglutaryl-CoA lyase [Oceanibacterium hippocampi]SLN65845.1 Hydroxymethylglutaryl-CoA lyase YngG [Oceanibacterium hippocampi]
MTIPRPDTVEIVDVSARDGLQSDKVTVSTEQKVELIRRLADAGLRRIEATSFVNPKRVPQMADASALLERLSGLEGLRLSALVLNEKGFERALAHDLHEITYVIPLTRTMAERNQNATPEALVEGWRSISGRAAEAKLFRSVTIAVAFGCPFEGRVASRQIAELAARIADAGVDEISLADTIGVAVPAEIEEGFARLSEAAPGLPMRAHLHNTRNTGYANADAAIRTGVRTLDASLGGLGGCPFAPGATGNIAIEDLAYMLDRSGIRSGLDAAALSAATLWFEGVMGRRLPGHLAHVGPAPTPRQAA